MMSWGGKLEMESSQNLYPSAPSGTCVQPSAIEQVVEYRLPVFGDETSVRDRALVEASTPTAVVLYTA